MVELNILLICVEVIFFATILSMGTPCADKKIVRLVALTFFLDLPYFSSRPIYWRMNTLPLTIEWVKFFDASI